MRIFGELTKVEEQDDGSLKVFGVASSGCRDDAGEIVTPAAMKAALPDYALYPALREMHQPSAAGRTLEAEVDADGFTRIVAHVVDPVAVAKVKSKTYAGFSIGGRVLERDSADRTVITKIKLNEISLVDRPANPEASLDLWKAAGLGEQEMAYAPTNDEVKARAGEMAKAAGKTALDAFKGYVAKAREALIAEHEVGELVDHWPIPERLMADTVAKYSAERADVDPARLAEIIETAAKATPKEAGLFDAIDKALEAEPVGTALIADPAAILAAALAKAKEADKPAEPASLPALDLAKTAAALRLFVAASDGKLAKGLYSVSRLAEIIEALTWLQQDTTWEAAGEGDGSPIPADIATHVAGLLSCLQSMVAEEAAEIVEAYQEQGMDIDLDVSDGAAVIIEAASSILDLAKADTALMEKVGARHSKADAAHIQASHDSMTKLGAMCDPENTPVDEADKAAKALAAEGLNKVALEAAEELTRQSGEIAELRKTAAAESERTAAAITEALEKFRKEPLAPRTAASTHAVIGKTEDASPGAEAVPTDDDVQKWLASLTPDQRAFELTKAAMRQPRRIAAA